MRYRVQSYNTSRKLETWIFVPVNNGISDQTKCREKPAADDYSPNDALKKGSTLDEVLKAMDSRLGEVMLEFVQTRLFVSSLHHRVRLRTRQCSNDIDSVYRFMNSKFD